MRYMALSILVAIVVQYALGAIMLLTGLAQPVVSAHITLGFLLAAGAIVLLVVAIRTRQVACTVLSAVGLLAVVAAAGTGFAFLRSGQGTYVVDMALSAGVAMLAYGSALFDLAGAIGRQHSG
jgi:heme A synthase